MQGFRIFEKIILSLWLEKIEERRAGDEIRKIAWDQDGKNLGNCISFLLLLLIHYHKFSGSRQHTFISYSSEVESSK